MGMSPSRDVLFGELRRRGPDGRLRWAVEIPDGVGPGQQIARGRRGDRLGAGEQGEAFVSLPAGGQQHSPGGRRGLQQARPLAFEPGRQQTAVPRFGAGREYDRAAATERQKEVEQ